MTRFHSDSRLLPAALWFALGAAALLGPGCHEQNRIDGGPVYPEMQQSRAIDVQVIRDETTITFTNTSAQTIPACRMWVNRSWSLDIEQVGIGETRRLDLRDFKDEFGESFRAGGFFATEAPDKVVAAQLEMGGEMVGLIVIGQ